MKIFDYETGMFEGSKTATAYVCLKNGLDISLSFVQDIKEIKKVCERREIKEDNLIHYTIVK